MKLFLFTLSFMISFIAYEKNVMATTRTAIMKQSELIYETGVQIRSGDPVTPTANDFHYNVTTNQLKYGVTQTVVGGGGGGGGAEAFATKSAGYQVTTSDWNILVTATASNLPLTGLPITAFAASGNSGKQFCVKKIDGGSIPVDVQAPEGFDSQGTHFYITGPNAANCFKSNGAAFFVF